MPRSLTWVAPLVFWVTSLSAADPAADLEARRKALNDLLNEQWEYNLRTHPI